jgi:non-specific serine/threonine protein kinase/serine/threonine-protein kinase
MQTSDASERDLIAAAFAQATPRASSAVPSGDLPPNDAFLGYELVRDIHRGGQGAVYLAIQKATKRRVAIKVMNGGPFQGSAGRARFEREVQVLGQLNHPNIVRIHDSGATPDGSCFYVMDYISGRSLEDIITDSKKLPIEDTLRLFCKICEAVNSAHLRGVIHRDLKPANIRINNTGDPVVVDFGLAKIAVPDVTDEASGHPRLMTMTGQFIGSLPWASPEQAEGIPDKIDVRTDVYSLGVILYQMLTGKFPYEVLGNIRDVLDNILRIEPARPSTIRRKINGEVETIVLKCLSKERDRRYQSAGELGRDIRHYLAGEPIEAKRDSGWYVISKTLRRHRLVTGFSAAFLVALAGFAVIVSLAWAAETREHRRAEANFELVRDLSRTFMYDFNQAIANLRGGTPAREMLFKKAKESLDKLKEQAGNRADDVGLQREIADAADLLGDIRAGLYLPKLGDVATARQNYAEARTIRERILADRVNDYRSHQDMGESHRRSAELLMTDLKYDEAIDEAKKGVAAYDEAIKKAAAEPAEAVTKLKDHRIDVVLVQANAQRALAETPKAGVDADTAALAAKGLYDDADKYWSARASADPADLKAARMLGVVRDRQAMTLIVRGTILVNQAADLLKAKPVPPESLNQAQDLVGRASQRFADARALAQTSLADFERLSKERRENAEWRRDCYLAMHNIGLTHMLTGDAYKKLADGGAPAQDRTKEEWTLAAASFDKAQEITDELARSDTSNLTARRDQVMVQNKSGNILRSLDQLPAAEQVFKRSLEVRRDLNQTDPSPRTHRDLAVGCFKLGEIYDLQAKGSEAAQKRALYRSAEQYLAESVKEFDGLRDAGGNSSDLASAKQAKEYLDKVRGELDKLPPG